jgi:uncharacterized protein
LKFRLSRFDRKKFFKLVLIAFLLTALISYIGISIIGATSFRTPKNRNIGELNPGTFGIAYEDVAITGTAADKITLRGWWMPNPQSDKAIIMLHGQNGTRACCIGPARRLWQAPFNVLMLDLRGHGQSDGNIHTFGLYEQWDVIGAVNFLKEKGFKPGKIGIIGWSMGAATAIMTASQTVDIGAVVSDSGYAEVSSLLRIFYPGTLFFTRWWHNVDLEQVKPAEAIKNLGNRQVLVIHGELDKNVPPGDAYKLKAAGGDNVELWVWKDTIHSGAYMKDRNLYAERVIGFFNRQLS